ncbi:DUF1120 domain-containing protein [Burkholderia aenigmatica]|uniref:DUF1120 domain-containing protein n=1 Tax=Burkholderia aenigmatica TaxID=2015348 RepID=UPI00264FEFDF|nr:DUF1120 domain-containing protein [Burkholderia aenigmatica]MDN7874851.1 DUF1120 domain-containing protein [Burkholderia aenigmatica]
MSVKRFRVLSVLASMLSSPGVTSAADLSVGGQIQAGGACSIALGNGGVIDFGNLSRKDFRADPTFGYIDRDMSLTINCRHPTKVAVEVIDNRSGTAEWSGWLGLGDPNTSAAYYITQRWGGKIDGRLAYSIRRSKAGSTWGDEGGDGFSPGYITSWKEDGLPHEPVAFQTLSAQLNIWVAIRLAILSNSFTDERKLDGSATLELVYL